MKSRMAIITIGISLILCLSGAKIQAEEKPGAFTLSPLIGGYLFEGTQELDNGLAYGLGLGYTFNDRWSAEAVLNHIDTESNLGGGDVDGWLYRLDALYNFLPFDKLVPYLAAGVGGITLDPDKSGSESDFLVNYGAGLKYFIRDNMALRGDVRHLMTFPDNNLLYTVGLTYFFGGEKKVLELPKDSDGDGIYDDLDRCPDTPQGVKVDASGCPPDTDGDGVLDYLDQCPDTPPGVMVDQKGCPLDSDGDGVYDYLDQCSVTPRGATVNQDGCWVLTDMNFDTAKWDIKPEFYKKLDEVAIILKKNPSLKIEVQGHTDNMGSARYNKMLSGKRAKAVMEYLVGKGTAPSRLSHAGYGFSRPLASNKTPEGRARNRRVALKPIR